MGEKVGIDDIIMVEGGQAAVKKSEPTLREKIREKLKKTDLKPKPVKETAKNIKPAKAKSKHRVRPAAGKSRNQKARKPAKKAKEQGKQEYVPKEKPKDVQELMKEARPPSREKAQAVLEAALFMANKPLMLDELARISGINSLGYLKQSLERIQKDFEGRGMHIVNDRNGWRMQVRQEHLPHVAHLTPYSDISEGCKRTLALLVYKEPMKQSHMIRIQGNKAYTYIKDLKRKGLMKTEKKGRTMMLKLTKEFDRYFGDERIRIREEMIKEFGDPSKVFAAFDREVAADNQKQANSNASN